MTIKEVLEFIKKTLEANVIAGVRAIKEHIFTVKLLSNKVEVTNPFRLPDTINTKEVSPVPVKDITEKQTKDIVSSFEKNVKALQKSIDSIKTYDTVSIKNIKDTPLIKEVTIKNPQRTVAITNLYEVQKEIGKLKKSIDSLKLNPTITIPDVIVPPVKVPKFVVPEPKVTIDLSRLEELMEVLTDDPKKPLSVRLSDGKKFYEAVSELKDTIVSAGGGGKYAFQDENGDRTYGLVDEDRHVQVDIVSGGGGELAYEQKYVLNHVDNETIPDTVFLCKESSTGEWHFQRIETTGIKVYSYASQKNNPTITNYTDAYNDRTTLSYGLFSEA
jgi:hypothetical protein